MMPSCVAVRHVAFEDLDALRPVLEQAGFAVHVLDAPLGDLDGFDPLTPDLLVVLGGPIGVYDEPDFPFLTQEIDLVRRRLEADRPTLGICLGAQIMARALGAAVYANPRGKEIGWSALTLAADPGPLAGLDQVSVLHWHGDTFDLPKGARCLASTAQTPHQAFVRGRALGLQFHVEASRWGLERWYVGHIGEISATPGVTVADLRAQAVLHADRTMAVGGQILADWLKGVCA